MTDIPPDPLPAGAPTEGPCQPWITLPDARAQCGILDTQIGDAEFNYGIQLASLVLWAATGRRYGLCKRTLMPCGPGVSHGFHGGATTHRPEQYPPVVASNYHGSEVYRSPIPSGCGCTLPALLLPGPIAFLDPTLSVRYNGTVIPTTSFKIKVTGIHGRTALLRTDGDGWWCCNDPDGDPTVATDTACAAWDVTYWQGRPVPNLGKMAAGMLAPELAKLVCNQECDNRMVPGLQQVARRGVVKTYQNDVAESKEIKRTGLPAVDDWVEAVNPSGLRRSPAIVRADDPELRRIWQFVEAA